MTLVPAFLTLLGEKSWYIPRWLDKVLPNITIEPPHDAEPAPAVSGQRTDRPAPSTGT
jgi:RND superfamily putative drug exporter